MAHITENIISIFLHFLRTKILKPISLWALTGHAFPMTIMIKKDAIKGDIEYLIFGRREKVTCPPLDFSIDPLPAFISGITGDYLIPQPFVAEINEVTLLPIRIGDNRRQYIVGLSKDGKIIPDIFRSNYSYNLFQERLINGNNIGEIFTFRNTYNRRTSIENRVQRAWIISTETRNDFYHFMLECLLRLQGLEYYTKTTRNDVDLLVTAPVEEWKKKLLKNCGYIDYIPLDRPVVVERLILPSWCSYDFIPSPDACNWLRLKIIQSVLQNQKPNKLPELIYFSRKKVRRPVVNEDQVMKMLSSYGFVMYLPEELPLEIMVPLMSEAKIIVSSHGAGLTNIIYCQLSPHVIECFGETFSKGSQSYYTLTSALGMPYHCLSCSYDSMGTNIDVERLKGIIENAIASVMF